MIEANLSFRQSVHSWGGVNRTCLSEANGEGEGGGGGVHLPHKGRSLRVGTFGHVGSPAEWQESELGIPTALTLNSAFTLYQGLHIAEALQSPLSLSAK